MSHSSLTSVYRQINKYLISLSLIFIFFLLFIFTVFSLNEYQSDKKSGGQVTQLKQQINYQQALIQTSKLLEKIINDKQATNFQSDHQQLMQQWQSLNDLLDENSVQFDSWLQENKKSREVINRISKNSAQNIQLLENSIEHIRLTLVALEKNISKKSRQQQQVYQLIMQGGTNDSVTINRAKTHVKVSAELESLKLLKQEFGVLSNYFSELTIKIPTDQFEETSKQVTKVLALYDFLISEANNGSAIFEINDQVDSLKLLLLTEQRVIAKWRGHLRLINNYRKILINQYNVLENIIQNESLDEHIYASADKANRNNYLNFINQKLSLAEQQIIFWLFVSGFTFFFIYLILRLRKTFSNYQETTQVDSVESQKLTSQEVENNIGKHSDTDQDVLLRNYLHQIDVLAQESQVAYWQLPNSSLTTAQQQILSVSETNDKHSWRAYFTHQGVVELLAKARLVKKNNCSQQLSIKTLNEQSITVTLCFDNNQWYGTLANCQKSDQLEGKLHDLEVELIHQSRESQKAEQSRNKTLNEMLIQLMLQSQSDFSHATASSAEMYRQLTCLLDWLRQKQLVSHLQISAKALSLNDVSLIDEIHAAIINAGCEARHQNNQILLQCDPQLMAEAKLDARLFQRLILAVCRILLQNLSETHLQFLVQVVDKNAGQQVVKISAEVFCAEKLTALPESLSLLAASNIEAGASITESDISNYFQALLQCQHGTNLDCQLTEQGYLMSFELPLAIVNQQVDKENTVNLKKANLLIISKNNELKETLDKYIKNADGVFLPSMSSDYFIDDLTLDILKRRPIKLIVLASDCYDSDFNKVTEHIISLPQEYQPKLMVMQGNYQIPLQHQGLYSFGNFPLSQGQFLNEVSDIINSDKQSNLVLDDKQCHPYQYSTSQVEVLFAVKSPEKHQPLLRVLHWLGLQVRVVSHAQAMKKHWQTGRYLVLLNEFSQTPFVTMTTGSSVQRGVFSFSEINTEHLSDQQLALSKKWQVDTLPTGINLTQLTALLAPWLKKHSALEVTSRSQNSDKSKISDDIKLPVADKGKVDSSSVKAKMASVVKDKKLAAIDKSQPFNMELYTKHQGTSELAIYMLDEYLESNDESLTELTSAIKSQDKKSALQELMVLMQNARILAADDLITLCLQLEKAINEEDSIKVNDNLIVTKKELSKIKKYASSL